jgi:hypothetical protein
VVLRDSKCRAQDSGRRTQDSGHRTQDSHKLSKYSSELANRSRWQSTKAGCVKVQITLSSPDGKVQGAPSR